MNKRDRDTLTFALSMLRTASRVMDHATIEWAEVTTAVHYIGHIVDGRAVDLADAARVEYELFVESQRQAVGVLDEAVKR